MSNDTVNGLEGRADHQDETALSVPPALELDPAKYLPMMADFDMTQAQKIEMLETLWAIMRSFVDLGFRMDICGQFLDNLTDLSGGESGGVEWPSSTKAETPSTRSGKDGSA